MKDTTQRQVVQMPQRNLLTQLRSRLILSIAALVFSLLLSASAGIYVSFNQQQLGTNKVTLHDNVNGLLEGLVNQETGLRGYVATNDNAFLEPYASGQVQYNTDLQKVKDVVLNNPDFRATEGALTQVEERAADWSTTFADVQLADMRNSNLTAARDTKTNLQGKALFDAIRGATDRLRQTSDSDLSALQTRANIINYSILGLALLLTILVISWLWYTFNRFTRLQRTQMENLKTIAEDFGRGNLSTRFEEGADVEFNQVGRTFNVMAQTLQEQQEILRDRDILEQVSQLNAILTESLDLTNLMELFFHRIFTLLDLQVAALYLYNPQQKTLVLFASYGAQKGSVQNSFAFGEGFIGRVAQEREPLFISSRKQNNSNFQVRTLVGAVLPADLYDLPLIHGNELLGVLAVGSIYSINDQARNVLNVISSTLASSVHNAQAYERIQTQTQELIRSAEQQEKSNRELRQQRDELTVLNAALEEANRVRSQFLSTMSHELRTPLTSIIGFSQMLLRPSAKTPLNERQTANIERILKNAQHLLSLINDVLDLAKIESGRMDINTVEINLHEMISSLLDETRSLAVERHLQLIEEIPDDIPTIETDPRKLHQILLNLVSNALKFTEKGSVTVKVTKQLHVTEEKGDIEQVVISVIDTGIGIPLEKQEYIFDAFYQVDGSNSRNYGGTGLGLAIVRELTTLLGGKVEIQSQPGQGSTFSIVLPLTARDQRFIQDLRLNTLSEHSMAMLTSRPVSTQPKAPESLPSTSYLDTENGQHLIVAIDDNADVLQLITAALEQSPYRVVGVQDSTQALSVVQKLQPKAITLDVMMPKMNGWQILHQLKSNPATAPIPVILLTVLEDRSAGYVLGADEYLVKPVARDALLNVLQQLTSRGLPPFSEGGSPPQETEVTHVSLLEDNRASEGAKSILLIHHEQDVQNLVERLVRDTGYSLQTTTHDQDVVKLIEQTHPDLLMMLIQLGDNKHLLSEQSGTIQKLLPEGASSPTSAERSGPISLGGDQQKMPSSEKTTLPSYSERDFNCENV